MQLKPGHTRKKISGDWRLLRCGFGGGWKREKNWMGYLLRGESLLKEVIEGWIIGKRPRGRKRLVMLHEFLKEASYAELKRKAENRKEWKTWKPSTCLTAEH